MKALHLGIRLLSHASSTHREPRANSGNVGGRQKKNPARTGQVVFTDDIEWIAAAGDYAELHCGGRCDLLCETMGALEQKLDPA